MLIELFLKYIRYELNLSTHTVLSYNNDLKQFVGFLGMSDDDAAIKAVTTRDVRRWIVSLSNGGDSARTIRRKVQALRSLYRFMMKRHMVEDNPAADVELAKVAKRLPSYVRDGNMNELLDGAVDESSFEAVRNKLMVMMLYETGIRRAELIGLLDANVDATFGEMKVHGKRNKDRIVPFGDELKEWIGKYRALRDSECGSTVNFFVRPSGEPMYESLVYRVVHSELQQVGGGSKLSPHVLRHSFASAMLNSGAEINSVKELLGHESLAATQVYTHITFKELKSNYEHAHPRALKKGGYYGS